MRLIDRIGPWVEAGIEKYGNDEVIDWDWSVLPMNTEAGMVCAGSITIFVKSAVIGAIPLAASASLFAPSQADEDGVHGAVHQLLEFLFSQRSEQLANASAPNNGGAGQQLLGPSGMPPGLTG